MNALFQEIESRLKNGEKDVVKCIPCVSAATVDGQSTQVVKIKIAGVSGYSVVDYWVIEQTVWHDRIAYNGTNPDLDNAIQTALTQRDCALHKAIYDVLNDLDFDDLLVKEVKKYNWRLLSDNLAYEDEDYEEDEFTDNKGQLVRIEGSKKNEKVFFDLFLQLPYDLVCKINDYPMGDIDCSEAMFDTLGEIASKLLHAKYSKDNDKKYAIFSFLTQREVVRYTTLENGNIRVWRSDDETDFIDLESYEWCNETRYEVISAEDTE